MKPILMFALVAVFAWSVRGEDCQTFCTLEFDPVCARDSLNRNSEPLTFPNKCAMYVASCVQKKRFEMLYHGECAKKRNR